MQGLETLKPSNSTRIIRDTCYTCSVQNRPYLSLVDCLYMVTYYLEKKSFNLVLTVNLPRTAPVTIYTRNAPLWGLIAPPRKQVDVRSFQNIASHAFQDNIYWLQISRVPNRCVKWTIFGTCRAYGICERISSYW